MKKMCISIVAILLLQWEKVHESYLRFTLHCMLSYTINITLNMTLRLSVTHPVLYQNSVQSISVLHLGGGKNVLYNCLGGHILTDINTYL